MCTAAEEMFSKAAAHAGREAALRSGNSTPAVW
jgi:hypothetical protein